MFNKDYYVVLFAGCSIGTLSGQPDSHATVIGRETEHCSSNSVVLFDLISCLCRLSSFLDPGFLVKGISWGHVAL